VRQSISKQDLTIWTYIKVFGLFFCCGIGYIYYRIEAPLTRRLLSLFKEK